jgi:hypothetical protein
MQEAASQPVLQRIHQQHQPRMAQVLEAQFPDTTATQLELLAHHYTEAGCREQAVSCWQQAGIRERRSKPPGGATCWPRRIGSR